MKRISYLPYMLLFPVFFLLLSLPAKVTERARSFAVSSLSPYWQGIDWLRFHSISLATRVPSSKTSDNAALAQENAALRSQLEHVKAWLVQEEQIKRQTERYAKLSSLALSDRFFQRRAEEVKEILRLEARALPALVSFREPTSWGSTVWINVGERHNMRLGQKVVCKNSPVVIGSSLVGVVEFVGDMQSRVRLITDSSLTVSVRAVRGGEQNRHLQEPLSRLLTALQLRSDLENKETVVQALNGLAEQLEGSSSDLYLAKGELKGSSAPLWRSRGEKLSGVGFNYDFSDAEGPARQLSSHLLKVGDLLVTTGFDGLFPAGLKVATISHVDPLREGATAYSLQALPLADLSALRALFVLPPS